MLENDKAARNFLMHSRSFPISAISYCRGKRFTWQLYLNCLLFPMIQSQRSRNKFEARSLSPIISTLGRVYRHLYACCIRGMRSGAPTHHIRRYRRRWLRWCVCGHRFHHSDIGNFRQYTLSLQTTLSFLLSPHAPAIKLEVVS